MMKSSYFYNNNLKEKKELIRKINHELETMNNVDLDYVLQQLCIMNHCLDKIAFPETHKASNHTEV